MSRQDIDDDARRYYGLPDRHGVLVSEVTAAGPAARAGIEPEDVIRRIEGDAIRTNDDLLTSIATRRPGDEVEIEVFRDGRTFTTHANLGERRIDRSGAAYIAADDVPDEPVSADTPHPSGLGIAVETYDVEELSERWRELADPRLRGVIVTGVELNSAAMDKGLSERMIIVTLNDAELTRQLVAALRTQYPKVRIFARGHNIEACQALNRLGAAGVVSENVEASLELSRMAMDGFGIETARSAEVLDAFRKRYNEQLHNPRGDFED